MGFGVSYFLGLLSMNEIRVPAQDIPPYCTHLIYEVKV